MRSQAAAGQRASVDTGELCRVPPDEMRTLEPEHSVSLDVIGDVHGEWDPVRVAQVVANLVGNACQHGEGPVRVTLTDDNDAVILAVHNAGPPIPPHKIQHLFEPFQHGGRRREGLGLGLYIVRAIVHAHGATIDVASTDTGTTVTVRWPRYAGAADN